MPSFIIKARSRYDLDDHELRVCSARVGSAFLGQGPTHRHKLVKADLVVLVAISLLHQSLDDLANFVPRKGQVGFLEQVLELTVTDEAIAVQVWGRKNTRI